MKFSPSLPPEIAAKAKAISEVVRHERLERGRPLSPTQFFTTGLRLCNNSAPDSPRDVIRAGLSSAAVQVAFSGEINQFFLDSFQETKNSLDEILTYQNVENFLPGAIITQYQSGQLTPQDKGAADHFSFGLKGENWALTRFTTQFRIDEQDLVNADQIDLVGVAVKEVARAAARVLPDLCYSLLLSNPAMAADGLPLFDPAHNNFATGPASSLQYNSMTVAGDGNDTIVYAPGPLEIGMAAIGSQTLTDDAGRPIHVNLTPKILITAPGCYAAGRRLTRHLTLQDAGDIEVRCESRLSSIGTTDPQTGNVISGSDGAWILGSPSELAASIVAGGLAGQGVKPVIETYVLDGSNNDAGLWGLSIAVQLDVAVGVVDWKSLYFSAGQ